MKKGVRYTKERSDLDLAKTTVQREAPFGPLALKLNASDTERLEKFCMETYEMLLSAYPLSHCNLLPHVHSSCPCAFG